MTFDDFVMARGRALWRGAFLLTGDRHTAEDLVQTALAKCHPHYERSGQGFEAYVRKAMYRTYVSWWRRKWNAETPTEHVPECSHDDGDLTVGIDVLRALGTLPKQQRAVMVLRYLEDKTIDEVSDILGIPPGTVKSHASRGCAALRASAHLQEAK